MKQMRNRRRRQRGMTLVEIMVVVVIMSLVTGVVGVAVFRALERANLHAAGIQISRLDEALASYRLYYRAYPGNGAGLVALVKSRDGTPPVMNSLPDDPWGAPYFYVKPGTRNRDSFDLWSAGPDGISGNEDDVGNWKSKKLE